MSAASDKASTPEDKQARKERRQAKSRSLLARFRVWKKQRPFMGGLLMVCSGAVILAPAYLSLRIKDLLVVISAISGVSTLMIGVLLIMFGIGAWTRPATAPYLGALGIITAVISLPTSNFGGFILGALLGIVGGALTLAWEEGEPKSKKPKKAAKPEEPTQDTADPNTGATAEDTSEATPETRGTDQQASPHTGTGAATVLSVVLGIAAAVAVGSTQQPAEAQTAHAEMVGRTSVVTADEVSVIGNVQAAVVEMPTQSGMKKMIKLSGERITVNTIALELPGARGGVGYLSSDPGTIATLQGSPAVLYTRTLTATPTADGIPTIPVSVDAEGNLDWVTSQLIAMGFPPIDLPDQLMEHISLRDVRLDAYGVFGDLLEAPALTVRATENDPQAPPAGPLGSLAPESSSSATELPAPPSLPGVPDVAEIPGAEHLPGLGAQPPAPELPSLPEVDSLIPNPWGWTRQP